LTIELVLLIIGLLIVFSSISSRVSDRFGIPSLLLFLAIGMLAGSEGIGGIYFDNPQIAQAVGFFALAVILFSGGLDTEWEAVKQVSKESIILATLGVFITALILGIAASFLLDISWIEGMLLGAIVSSTDAAAVFSLLRSKGVRLKKHIASILELESGSNDPMAAFLTVGVIQLITNPDMTFINLLGLLLLQMVVGAFMGWLFAKALLFLINRLKLGYEGLYPVLAFGWVLLTFAVTLFLKGSGFLAVYIMGLMLAKTDFLHKNSLSKFFDGFAWLAQIVMFLALGLFVFPSQLVPILLPALILAIVLMFIARPVSVWLCLMPFKNTLQEKTFISWVGLRGAVPIILATYPMLAGLDASGLFFNIIFFIVILSVLLQGSTIPFFARKLKLEDTSPEEIKFPITATPGHGWPGILRELNVNAGSPIIGKSILELGLPKNYIIILIAREDRFFIPNGSTVFQVNDRILGLASTATHQSISELMDAQETQ